jgi:hypothetical protein
MEVFRFCRHFLSNDNERKLLFSRSTYHLSSFLATVQKEFKRLGGIFSSKIDDTVGIMINLQDIFPFKFFNMI